MNFSDANFSDTHPLAYAQALECVSAVYRALDASDAVAASRWFMPDAVWHRPDGALTGVNQIEDMVRARPPGRTTAHIVGNLEIQPEGASLIARYYLTVYAGKEGTGTFAAILLCEDRLSATAHGLRIAEKRNIPLLRAAAP